MAVAGKTVHVIFSSRVAKRLYKLAFLAYAAYCNAGISSVS